MSESSKVGSRRRLFLLLASAWNLAAGGILLSTPTRRARLIGGVVLVFSALYAVLARRPVRALLIAGAIAKTAGGVSGVFGWWRGDRDVVTVISVADAAWAPGFALLAWRRNRRG